MENLMMITVCAFLMGIVGLLSVAYTATNPSVTHISEVEAAVGLLYDSGGHACCDYNLSYVGIGEEGWVSKIEWDNHAGWTNWTIGLITDYPVTFPIYFDEHGEKPVMWADVSNGIVSNPLGGDTHPIANGSEYWGGIDYVSNDYVSAAYLNILAGGLAGLMVAVVAAVLILSVNVLSTGLNWFGTRTLVTILFFSGLWAILSSLSISVLTEIPVFGWLMYVFMTFAYFFGVWGEVNGGGV